MGPKHPLLAQLALVALVLLSLLGAWIIVLEGGVLISPGKSSTQAFRVSGYPAMVLAGVQLGVAATGLIALLQPHMSKLRASLSAFVVVFVPACLHWLLR